jgi:hypothetical protein
MLKDRGLSWTLERQAQSWINDMDRSRQRPVMSGAPDPDDRPPDQPGRTLRLILELELEQELGETVHGTVGPTDRLPIGFRGWIGLMSAINEFCSEAGKVPPRHQPGAMDDVG